MDIVLEIFDTFLFDWVYGKLLPVATPVFIHSGKNVMTSTLTSLREGATMAPQYTYHPATQFFSLEPSAWAYRSAWQRDNIYRQATSLFMITWLFGLVIYFIFSSLSYIFVFDKAAMKHPKFLKNQIRLEIRQTMIAMPFMSMLTTPFFTAEVRGYGKLYDTPAEAPFKLYNFLQFPLFLLFTDFFIYLIHRGLHLPLLYKRLHKPHHKWIMPTPYASHAFHPVDGWAQSVPYHVFPFLFPLQKLAYIGLFIFINIWTIIIHDGEYVANSPIVNGAACHAIHHLAFNFNFGQFFTLWDRVGGSYREPNKELFSRETKMSPAEWARQQREMERIVKEVEGEDDRTYGNDDTVVSIQQKKIL